MVKGISKSCGCKSVACTIARNTTHGMCGTSEYGTWQQMVNRCTNPKAINWKDYGGRGIKVCDRWRFGEDGNGGFECFFEDMGLKPSPELTLHRVKNDGNYKPTNCIWATWIVQVNESRHNNMLTWKGRTQSLSNWAREVNLSRSALSNRINKGKWPVEKALTTPLKSA